MTCDQTFNPCPQGLGFCVLRILLSLLTGRPPCLTGRSPAPPRGVDVELPVAATGQP